VEIKPSSKSHLCVGTVGCGQPSRKYLFRPLANNRKTIIEEPMSSACIGERVKKALSLIRKIQTVQQLFIAKRWNAVSVGSLICRSDASQGLEGLTSDQTTKGTLPPQLCIDTACQEVRQRQDTVVRFSK
jgi:hypothetical protein